MFNLFFFLNSSLIEYLISVYIFLIRYSLRCNVIIFFLHVLVGMFRVKEAELWCVTTPTRNFYMPVRVPESVFVRVRNS